MDLDFDRWITICKIIDSDIRNKQIEDLISSAFTAWLIAKEQGRKGTFQEYCKMLGLLPEDTTKGITQEEKVANRAIEVQNALDVAQKIISLDKKRLDSLQTDSVG
jgi:hypothetical protein